MKRCPSCARTYTDDSLAFCLEDGSTLVGEASGSSGLAATLVIPEPRATTPARPDMAFPIAGPAQPPQPAHYSARPPAWMGAASPPAIPAAATPPGRGLSVTALICAIASFALLGFCILGGATGVDESLIGGIFIFSALLGLVGALLGITAIVKAGRDPNLQNSKVLAVVGLALNGIYLLLVVIFLIVGAVSNS